MSDNFTRTAHGVDGSAFRLYIANVTAYACPLNEPDMYTIRIESVTCRIA